MELIDIGVNLSDKAFAADRDEVIARARGVGVSRMILTGTDERASTAAADLAASRPDALRATAGVHPHNAARADEDTLLTLRALARRPEVVAIGECGLDYNRDFSSRPAQRELFAAQLELAAEIGMPVFVHERDAHADLRAMLAEVRDRLPAAVVHCFTGTKDELRGYLDLDLHIGITGWICDERRGLHLHELIPQIPADRLMVETDAPYLMPRTIRPRPKRGRNEPAFLVHVVETVAECAGKPVEQVAAETTRTAEAFFGLAG